MKVKFLTQNMTEGQVTSPMKTMDFLSLQEISPVKIHDAFDERIFGIWIPRRDRHQAIVWRKSLLNVSSSGWIHFHNSGKAEGYPFGTPARGMPFINGVLDNGRDASQFGLWFLNSWESMSPDNETHIRYDVVTQTSIPKVKAKIEGWMNAKRAVFGGGDINSLKWKGNLHRHLDQGHFNGLDRTWNSDDITIVDKFTTPKTGVGNDMQHEGKGVVMEIPDSKQSNR